MTTNTALMTLAEFEAFINQLEQEDATTPTCCAWKACCPVLTSPSRMFLQ